METKCDRSPKVSDRSTPSSRISRPGSAVDLILGRIGAVQENIGAVGAAQVETREVLETVIHRLECLEASPVPKFVAGLDLNPSLSNEMTAAPTHSSISLEAKQGNQ